MTVWYVVDCCGVLANLLDDLKFVKTDHSEQAVPHFHDLPIFFCPGCGEDVEVGAIQQCEVFNDTVCIVVREEDDRVVVLHAKGGD